MSSQPQQLQVESADVVKLILQFLSEHQYTNALNALQQDSSISLNSVDDKPSLLKDIREGRWERVLPLTQHLTLPASVAQSLHEQVFLELLESNEYDTARAMMRQSQPLIHMRHSAPEKVLQLEHALNRCMHGQEKKSMWEQFGGNKEERRKQIASDIEPHITTIPPSRLLTLLNQSLKYQQLIGTLPVSKGNYKYDLLRGQSVLDTDAVSRSSIEDVFPTKNSRIIKFAAKSYPECCSFSPDGSILASGSTDGYIELWDAETGKLSMEFEYQAEDNLMSHDAAILALKFSWNQELLASGSAKGEVKVWRLATGSCVRKYPAHSEGVTCLEFVRDASSLLSASFDGTIKVHGLKSGRTIKEFRGHTSFVNAIALASQGDDSSGENRLSSASADGTIRCWDMKTCDCLKSIKMQSTGLPLSLLAIIPLPTPADRFAVVERSAIIRIINGEGVVIQQFQSTSTGSGTATTADKQAGAAAAAASSSSSFSSSSTAAAASSNRNKRGGTGVVSNMGDFVAACVSPKGKYLYAVTEECVMHVFEIATGKLVHAIKTHRSDIIGITHHPFKNMIASFSQEGNIKLWS